MQTTPRFGLIGAGSIGRIHLEALRSAGLPVIALADPSPAALEQSAPLAPGAKTYADWRDLLRDPEVTAVNICTISSLHLEILQAAVASGKHVLCEKTMTTTGAEARAALALKPAPGQVVQVGYMKRFFPASRWVLEHLPEIGRPICATVRTYQSWGTSQDIFDNGGWKPIDGKPSHIRFFASGGMLAMGGSHLLDMTNSLLGPPRVVTCRTWAPADYDVEVHAHGLFEMQNGTLVHFESCASNFDKTGAYQNGWDEYIQIDGTHGRLEIFFPVWNKPLENPARARLYRNTVNAWEEPTFPIVNPFQLEMEAFALACRNGQPATPSIRDGALVDLWIDACYQSAASGLPVPVTF